MVFFSNTLATNFGGNGGGLLNSGITATLTMVNSTVSDNSVSGGGSGLYNDQGAVTLSSSTFSSNQIQGLIAQGGTIFNSSGQITLTNDTLSGNTAPSGGGIYNLDGAAMLTNVTLNGNSGTGGAAAGGGLYQQSNGPGQALTLRATIVANSPSGGDCSVAAGSTISITSVNYNLSSDGSCDAFFNQPNDQTHIDPKLGALQDNGGPTLTHLPAADSPAIDHGGPNCPATDQRGFFRPHGVACDAGAVEFGAVAPLKTYLPVVLK